MNLLLTNSTSVFKELSSKISVLSSEQEICRHTLSHLNNIGYTNSIIATFSNEEFYTLHINEAEKIHTHELQYSQFHSKIDSVLNQCHTKLSNEEILYSKISISKKVLGIIAIPSGKDQQEIHENKQFLDIISSLLVSPILNSNSHAINPILSNENSCNSAILSTNLEGIITGWNQGASQLFGFKQSNIVSKPFSVLFPIKDRDTVPYKMMNKLGRYGEFKTECRFLKRNGEIFKCTG